MQEQMRASGDDNKGAELKSGGERGEKDMGSEDVSERNGEVSEEGFQDKGR